MPFNTLSCFRYYVHNKDAYLTTKEDMMDEYMYFGRILNFPKVLKPQTMNKSRGFPEVENPNKSPVRNPLVH
jgi:hypothetical protein